MFAAILAQHAPLIRDYPGAPPTPPAPPAPPTPPEPPQAEPIAFSAVVRPSLFGIIGDAISSTTLATITCADAAMTIVLSETVAGLTFSYSAGILTVAGTPTGSTRRQRVVVSYIASDGSNSVRGSTSHEITLVKATEVLTIGSQSGAAGRVGRPLSATLASPSANYNVNVTAHPASLIPGCTASLDWTPGATSSGTLTLTGTPTRAGTLPLVVNYRSGASELGTSTHSVVIAEAYEPTPADPDPTASPTPVVPADPGPVTPTPMPGRGPDPFRLQTKVLLHFDEVIGGVGYDPARTEITLAGKNDAPGQNWFNSPHCYQQVNPGLGRMQQFGYSPMAGGYFSLAEGTRSRMEAGMAGISGNGAELTIECLADIHQVCWDAHRAAAGSINRFTPFITLMGADGSLAWSIGIFSTSGISYSTADNRRVVMTAMVSRKNATAAVDFLIGRYLLDRPAKFIHVAFQRTNAFGVQTTAGWTEGAASINTDTWSGGFADPAGAVCRIGNHCPGLSALAVFGGGSADSIPFVGALDEVRVTAAARYSAFINSTLPPVARVIPWPNY